MKHQLHIQNRIGSIKRSEVLQQLTKKRNGSDSTRRYRSYLYCVQQKEGRPPSVIHVPEVEMPRKRAAEPEAQREKSEKRELNKHFQR